MNPLKWSRQHQIAGVLASLMGALVGLLFAWLESPFRRMSLQSLSGEWADYSGVFLLWVKNGLYQPWPILGAIVSALMFYFWRLVSFRDDGT